MFVLVTCKLYDVVYLQHYILKPKKQSTLLTVLAHHAHHEKGENWKLKGWGVVSQMQCTVFSFFSGRGGGGRSVCFKL